MRSLICLTPPFPNLINSDVLLIDLHMQIDMYVKEGNMSLLLNSLLLATKCYWVQLDMNVLCVVDLTTNFGLVLMVVILVLVVEDVAE